MSDTSIEWTDKTWNPTRGCSRVSAGCDHCYAMREAHRHDHPGGAYEGLTRVGSRGVDWNGKVRLVPEMLDQPLRWRKPQRIFVNSMSDLFHESLPDEAIAAVFGVMAAAPRHTFQILTKRPSRAKGWFAAWSRAVGNPVAECKAWAEALGPAGLTLNAGLGINTLKYEMAPWPLPNVWLGDSVEDQATADERIPKLLQTPAAVRFISLEPQLEHVDLRHWLPFTDAVHPHGLLGTGRPEDNLSWVIVGGESGPGARPFDVAWARSTVAQCKAAGVPVFVKQLGSRWARGQNIGRDASLQKLRNSKGGDPSEWEKDLRVREFPR